MGKKTAKSTEPLSTEQARRSVRQVEILSKQDCVPESDMIVDESQVSVGACETVTTQPDMQASQDAHDMVTHSSRNMIIDDGQVPSSSQLSQTPTMEQFMILQNSLFEMRSLMSEIKNSHAVNTNVTGNISVQNAQSVDNNVNTGMISQTAQGSNVSVQNAHMIDNVNQSMMGNNTQGSNLIVQNAQVVDNNVIQGVNNQNLVSNNLVTQGNIPIGSHDPQSNIVTSVNTQNQNVHNYIPVNTSVPISGNMHRSSNNPTGRVMENLEPVLPNFPTTNLPAVTQARNVVMPDQPDMNSVNTTINQAVNQQIQSIISQGEYMPQSEGSFDDISRVIDLKVSDKLKNQIWSNQYVNLASLLDNKTTEVYDGYRLVSGEGDQLCVTQNKVTRKLTGLSQWCDAFLIYLTVYSRKYPSATPSLTTYMSNIKMLHHKGGDFLFYDEEFRFMRQRNPSIGWSINSNLWLECRDVRGAGVRSQGRRPNGNFRGQSAGNTKSNHPAGFCYKFHTQGRCPNFANCNYKHFCYTNGCNAKHPIYQCTKKSGNTSGNNSGQNKQTNKQNNNTN